VGRELALVHSGGGLKGAIQVGATWHLYARHGLRPTRFAGTSVGALNVTKLAETSPLPLDNPDPAPQVHGIEGLWTIWRSLRADMDVMVQNDRQTNPTGTDMDPAITNWTSQVWRDLGLKHQYGIDSVPAKILGLELVLSVSPFVGLVTAVAYNDLVDDVTALSMQDSLFTLGPMRHFLGTAVDFDAVSKHLGELGADNEHRLLVNYVDSRSGQRCYVSFDPRTTAASVHAAAGAVLDERLRPTGRPMVAWADAVLASAAIPALISDVTLHDAIAYDGGLREVTPLAPVLLHGDRDVVAVTGPAYSYRAFRPGVPHPLFRGRMPHGPHLTDHAFRTIDLLTDQIMGVEERPSGPVAVEGLHHIRPDIDVISTFDVSPVRIRMAARYGAELAFALCDPALRNLSARVEARNLATAKAFALAAAVNDQEVLEQHQMWEIEEWYGATRWNPGTWLTPAQFAAQRDLVGLSAPCYAWWTAAHRFNDLLAEYASDVLAAPTETEVPGPWFDTGDVRISPGLDGTGGEFGRMVTAYFVRLRSQARPPRPAVVGRDPGTQVPRWCWPSGSGPLKVHQRGALSAEYPRSARIDAGTPDAADDHHGDGSTDESFSIRYGQTLVLGTAIGGRARRLSRPQHGTRWSSEASHEPATEPDERVVAYSSIPLPYGLTRGAVHLITTVTPTADGFDRSALDIVPDRLAPEGLIRSRLRCTGTSSAMWWDDGTRTVRIVVAVPNGAGTDVYGLEDDLRPKHFRTIPTTGGDGDVVVEAAIGQIRAADGDDATVLMTRVSDGTTSRIEQSVLTASFGLLVPTTVVSLPGEDVRAGPCFMQVAARTANLRAVYATSGAELDGGGGGGPIAFGPAPQEIFLTGTEHGWQERHRRASCVPNPTGAFESSEPLRFGLAQLDDGRPGAVILIREVTAHADPDHPRISEEIIDPAGFRPDPFQASLLRPIEELPHLDRT
jgi:predicted acylesterase/phospholipase RssA